MNCHDFDIQLDDYLDGALETATVAAIDAHLDDCGGCRSRLEHARRVVAAVSQYGRADLEVPSDAWMELALKRAAWQGAKRERRRRWSAAAAVAAAVAILWIVVPPGGPGSAPEPAAGVPSVAMSVDEPKTVRLVFSSTTALPDATLTVSLPEGLELAGFAGQREITWSTSLTPGKNVLALELIATSPVNGDVYATLRHADEEKTFRLRVDADHDASLPLGLNTEKIA